MYQLIVRLVSARIKVGSSHSQLEPAVTGILTQVLMIVGPTLYHWALPLSCRLKIVHRQMAMNMLVILPTVH